MIWNFGKTIIKTKKEEGALFKIDFEKTCVHIKWNLLEFCVGNTRGEMKKLDYRVL